MSVCTLNEQILSKLLGILVDLGTYVQLCSTLLESLKTANKKGEWVFLLAGFFMTQSEG